ncbi:MAG TPA: septum formation initiator family protein, partial [Candidatus Deferrimicrobium sp.]
LRGEVEKLRQENALLKRTVEDLRGNPAVIEQEARRLGLIKEGENVIVVPQQQVPRPQASTKPGANRP